MLCPPPATSVRAALFRQEIDAPHAPYVLDWPFDADGRSDVVDVEEDIDWLSLVDTEVVDCEAEFMFEEKWLGWRAVWFIVVFLDRIYTESSMEHNHGHMHVQFQYFSAQHSCQEGIGTAQR